VRRRVHDRLTYANVMATLAVFIALGGSTYAAVKIDGADIRKRSIAGNRLKPNTVTGKQVRERRLGKVRRASRADTSGRAARADSAGQAGFASRATSAVNSARLGGLSASAFTQNSRFSSGVGNVTAVPEQTIVSWPGFAKITTDGDADDVFTVKVAIPAGAQQVRVFHSTGNSVFLEPDQGFGITPAPTTNSLETIVIQRTAAPQRAQSVVCFKHVNYIGCIAQATPQF
jgi:hypothetical protein